MAKGTRGGRRGTGGGSGGVGGSGGGVASGSAPQQPQNVVSTDNTQPANSLSANYAAFQQMTDDQKADAIRTAIQQGVPDHLNKTSEFQAVLYNLGVNDKPTVVSDSTFNTMGGQTLYRTVDAMYDRQKDISFTAPQMAAQVQKGKTTYVSGINSSVYGQGIYFATNRSDSTSYGSYTGNIQKTCVMRAKLNSNANVTSYRSAYNGMQAEIASGSKLGRTLSRMNSSAAVSVWAFSKGYHAMDNGWGYITVLNRGALTMSDTVTAK